MPPAVEMVAVLCPEVGFTEGIQGMALSAARRQFGSWQSMSRDVFGVRKGGQWVEPRDAPELSVMHRTAPPRVTQSPGWSVWRLRNWRLRERGGDGGLGRVHYSDTGQRGRGPQEGMGSVDGGGSGSVPTAPG